MATAFERGDCTLLANALLILTPAWSSSFAQAFTWPYDKLHQERTSDKSNQPVNKKGLVLTYISSWSHSLHSHTLCSREATLQGLWSEWDSIFPSACKSNETTTSMLEPSKLLLLARSHAYSGPHDHSAEKVKRECALKNQYSRKCNRC